MSNLLWSAGRHAGLSLACDWSRSDPFRVLAILEVLCADAALDGFADVTTERLVAASGAGAAEVDRIIEELVARQLIAKRFSPRGGRRLFELGVDLRLVYRLVAQKVR